MMKEQEVTKIVASCSFIICNTVDVIADVILSWQDTEKSIIRIAI